MDVKNVENVKYGMNHELPVYPQSFCARFEGARIQFSDSSDIYFVFGGKTRLVKDQNLYSKIWKTTHDIYTPAAETEKINQISKLPKGPPLSDNFGLVTVDFGIIWLVDGNQRYPLANLRTLNEYFGLHIDKIITVESNDALPGISTGITVDIDRNCDFVFDNENLNCFTNEKCGFLNIPYQTYETLSIIFGLLSIVLILIIIIPLFYKIYSANKQSISKIIQPISNINNTNDEKIYLNQRYSLRSSKSETSEILGLKTVNEEEETFYLYDWLIYLQFSELFTIYIFFFLYLQYFIYNNFFDTILNLLKKEIDFH